MTPSVPNSVPLFIRRPPVCGMNVTLHTVHHLRNNYGVLNPLPSSGISEGKAPAQLGLLEGAGLDQWALLCQVGPAE
jgi:hypothetical protein